MGRQWTFAYRLLCVQAKLVHDRHLADPGHVIITFSARQPYYEYCAALDPGDCHWLASMVSADRVMASDSHLGCETSS